MRARLLVFLVIALGAGIALGRPALAQQDPAALQWEKYRTRFLAPEGRVLDTGNRKISHTEGQGWAMLFAAAFDDRDDFERVWRWTRDNLQRPDGALFSWRWDPSDKTPVSDANNASDGDILIAWALIRAGREWKEPEYTRAAHRIVADIRHKLVARAAKRLVLLPGYDGFKSEDGTTTINPSYYVYPALKEFSRLMPAPEWPRLRRDGLALLAQARFGRWRLTPDWVGLTEDGAVEPAGKFPARFGFDAVRVPLYLIWGGDANHQRLASYVEFWSEFGDKPIPAWADLKDDTLAPYAASTGVQAVAALTRGFHAPEPAALPEIGDADDYYSASLILLARLAQREAGR